jgi:hypothetical protein
LKVKRLKMALTLDERVANLHFGAQVSSVKIRDLRHLRQELQTVAHLSIPIC